LLRSDPAAAYDRQFALGSEPEHITRGNRRVIDDDTRCLDPRFGGLGRHIVKRSRCHLCQRCDIIKESD
jgi:hypothetical protein